MKYTIPKNVDGLTLERYQGGCKHNPHFIGQYGVDTYSTLVLLVKTEYGIGPKIIGQPERIIRSFAQRCHSNALDAGLCPTCLKLAKSWQPSAPMPAESDSLFLATDLGKKLGVSGAAFNKILEKAGLQERRASRWFMTEAAEPYGCYVQEEVGNLMIPLIRWRESVLEILP